MQRTPGKQMDATVVGEKFSLNHRLIRLNSVFIDGSIIHQTARQQFHFLNLDIQLLRPLRRPSTLPILALLWSLDFFAAFLVLILFSQPSLQALCTRIMVGLDVFEKLLVKRLELSNTHPTAILSSSNFSRTTDLGRVLQTVPLCATASNLLSDAIGY